MEALCLIMYKKNYNKTYASMDSDTLPIWFTFNKRQLHAFLSIPVCTRLGLVTNKSSL